MSDDGIEFRATGKSQIAADNRDGVKKAKPMQISAFKVLINPNIKVLEDDEDFKDIHDKVYEVSEGIFDDLSTFKEFVQFKDGKKWGKGVVKSVENYYTVEYGPQNRTFHVNAYCEIHHFSNIQLDIKKLRSEYGDHLGIEPKAVFVNIQILDSEAKKIWLNYMRKDSDIPA